MFMKATTQSRLANIVFDDRDYGTNTQMQFAITNFFHEAHKRGLDSIRKTPCFAISHAQFGLVNNWQILCHGDWIKI